jgi:hypothetical protein
MCPKKLQQTQQSQKPRTDRDKQTPHTDPSGASPQDHQCGIPLINGRNLGKIQRCSRPLCSSQATDEPTRRTTDTTTSKLAGLTATQRPVPPETLDPQGPAHPPHHAGTHQGHHTQQDTMTRSRGRLPQDPTVCSANPHLGTLSVPARTPRGDTGVLASSTARGGSSSMFHP